jgi:hypothetical protein
VIAEELKMPQDELSVDLNAVHQEFSKNSDVVRQNEEAAVEAADLNRDPSMKETIEVEDGDFWDVGDQSASSQDSEPEGGDDLGEQPEVSDKKEESKDDSGSTLSYKANGKDVTLDLKDLAQNKELQSDIAKKLALVDGARKAFDEKAKYRREYKKLKQENEEVRKYKDSWDRLEAIKDDHEQLFEVITGQSYTDFMQREIERKRLYEDASPSEQRAMDYEAKLAKIERERAREKQEREEQIQRAESLEYEAEKKTWHSKMTNELDRYSFDGVSDGESNKLREMVWVNAVADATKYVKMGYPMSDKLIRKAVRDNAKTLASFYKTTTTTAAKADREQRKAEAQVKAEGAATKNFSNEKDFADLVTKNPLDIFRAFQRGRK